jgi:hypothetical protein
VLLEPVWARQTFVSEIRHNCTRFSITRRYMRHSTWVKMHTNELIIDTINTEADRVADREESRESESGEPSTDQSTVVGDEIVTEESDDRVEVRTGGNRAPALEGVPEVQVEEAGASTDSAGVIEGYGNRNGE